MTILNLEVCPKLKYTTETGCFGGKLDILCTSIQMTKKLFGYVFDGELSNVTQTCQF